MQDGYVARISVHGDWVVVYDDVYGDVNAASG